VNGSAATTAGTLRYALTNAQADDIIVFRGAIAGETAIGLTSALPTITKNMVIEGNGVVLTHSTMSEFNALYVNTPAVATIRRLHFSGGRAASYGGAIRNAGNLTLESCIFSGNRTSGIGTTGSGGAIYNTSVLTVRGCTFYGNNTSANTAGGGALYSTTATLTLTGNLFYGNTGGTTNGCPILRGSSGSASYNVVDVPFGTTSTDSGWAQGTGDKTTLDDGDSLTIEGVPFTTSDFIPVLALQNSSVIPSSPQDFPLTDFYGTTRTFPGSPGAVASSPSL
jgi:hypothetical protein